MDLPNKENKTEIHIQTQTTIMSLYRNFAIKGQICQLQLYPYTENYHYIHVQKITIMSLYRKFAIKGQICQLWKKLEYICLD